MRDLHAFSRPLKRPGPRGYLPHIEPLEDRQPVSDTFLGGMLAWSILGLNLPIGEFGTLNTGLADKTLPPAPAQLDLVGTVPAREGKSWDRVLGVAAPAVERHADSAGPRALASAVPDHNLSSPLDSAGPRPELGRLLLGRWTLPPVSSSAETGSAVGGSPSAPANAAVSAGFQPLATSSLPNTIRAADQALLVAASNRAANPAVTSTPATRQAVEASLADNSFQAPVSYEANQGQTDPTVQFLTRGPGYTLFLTSNAAILSFDDSGAVIRMGLTGANPAPQVTGLDPLPGRVNYFLGNDPTGWHADIPTFARVRYQDVYPGIDLVYHGSAGRPEYDFIMAPGVDPAVIRLNYAGADQVTIDAQGNLVVRAGSAELQQAPPVAFQIENGIRRAVPSAFQLASGHEVRFTVGAYDPNQPLVIDPYFAFSTYLGGSGNDEGWGIAADVAGNVFVTGFTNSPNFPGTPPPQSRDVFVTQFSADGQRLIYSTILGGNRNDEGRAIALDNQDNAYVTGFTDSPDFPLRNPFQRQLFGRRSAFVTALNRQGGLAYSSYLGGPGKEEGRGIAVDANGFAYVTGITSSQSGFIFNSGQLQARYGGGNTDAFVVQILPGGDGRGFSTYLGGARDEDVGFYHNTSPNISGGIAVGRDGNIYVTGTTASANFPIANPFQAGLRGQTNVFVTEIEPRQLFFRYSTYLGGSGNDQGHAIAIGPDNSVYVTGQTNSQDFPTVNPYQPTLGGDGATNAFATRFLPNGAPPLFSTYLGGEGQDQGNGIAVTRLGSAYVTGKTSSVAFPTINALQPTYGGGRANAFLTKFQAGGDLRNVRASTYIGGPGTDQAQAVAVVPYRRGSSGPCGVGGPLGPGGLACDDNATVTGFAKDGYPLANAFQDAYGGGAHDAVVSEVVDCPCQPSNVSFTVDANGIAHLSWDDLCEDYTSEYDIRIWINGVEQPPITVYPPNTTADMDVMGGDPMFEINSVNSCCDSPAVHVP